MLEHEQLKPAVLHLILSDVQLFPFSLKTSIHLTASALSISILCLIRAYISLLKSAYERATRIRVCITTEKSKQGGNPANTKNSNTHCTGYVKC